MRRLRQKLAMYGYVSLLCIPNDPGFRVFSKILRSQTFSKFSNLGYGRTDHENLVRFLGISSVQRLRCLCHEFHETTGLMWFNMV